jgi:hypothetical protein
MRMKGLCVEGIQVSSCAGLISGSPQIIGWYKLS